MMRSAASLLIFAVSIALAQAEETLLDGVAIKRVLSDAILVGSSPAAEVEQVFQASGVTLYRENGAHSQGFWRVDNDKYCSVWPPSEHWTCFDVLRDGAFITFVSSNGTRYPMRAKETSE